MNLYLIGAVAIAMILIGTVMVAWGTRVTK